MPNLPERPPQFHPPLTLSALRGGWLETTHPASWLVCDAEGRILQASEGAESQQTVFRSSAKPFQALPMLDCPESGDLPLTLLAIASASHVGSAAHLHCVADLLARAHATEADLLCGPHEPLDRAERCQLHLAAQPPGRRHNNCSGKHAGMLWACHHHGWPKVDYLDPTHPLQQAILGHYCTWTGLPKPPTVIDGCDAPVPVLPMSAMAHLYARLGVDEYTARLVSAMTKHPVLVGGQGRVDTAVMEVSRGALLAKVGAAGVVGVSRVGRGEGLFLKLADGGTDSRDRTLVHLLGALGWLTPADLADPRLAPWATRDVMNTQGRIVGEFLFSGINL